MKRHSKDSEVQSTGWEKIIAYHVSDKGLILKTHMNPCNTMNTKKTQKVAKGKCLDTNGQ